MMMGPNNSVCMVCISWSSLWSCSDDMMSRKKHLEISMQLEDPSCSISPCFVFNTTGEVDPFCKRMQIDMSESISTCGDGFWWVSLLEIRQKGRQMLDHLQLIPTWSWGPSGEQRRPFRVSPDLIRRRAAVLLRTAWSCCLLTGSGSGSGTGTQKPIPDFSHCFAASPSPATK